MSFPIFGSHPHTHTQNNNSLPQTNTLFWNPQGPSHVAGIVKRKERSEERGGRKEGVLKTKRKKKEHSLNVCLHEAAP